MKYTFDNPRWTIYSTSKSLMPPQTCGIGPISASCIRQAIDLFASCGCEVQYISLKHKDDAAYMADILAAASAFKKTL